MGEISIEHLSFEHGIYISSKFLDWMSFRFGGNSLPLNANMRLLFACRTSPAEFIVPFDQYRESIKSNYSIGMRFKMRFEGEEAPEQRYGSLTIVVLLMKYLICSSLTAF